MRNKIFSILASIALASNMFSSLCIAEELEISVAEEIEDTEEIVEDLEDNSEEEEFEDEAEEEIITEEVSDTEPTTVVEVIEELVENISDETEENVSEDDDIELEEEIEEEETESDEELTFKELYKTLEGYSISVSGNMPEDTTLVASIIDNTVAENEVSKSLGDNKEFTAEITFDIKLMFDNQEYQPTNFDENVNIVIAGVNSDEALDVFRITNDGKVTNMNARTSGEGVEFTTDHFTTYTVGGTSISEDIDNLVHMERVDGLDEVRPYRLVSDGQGGQKKEYIHLVYLGIRSDENDTTAEIFADNCKYKSAFYWVKDFRVNNTIVLDESDTRNERATSRVYDMTLTCIDGSEINIMALPANQGYEIGDDGVWDTEDDYDTYSAFGLRYQLNMWTQAGEETDINVYPSSSGETITIDLDQVREIESSNYRAYIEYSQINVAQYNLKLVDEAGNTIVTKSSINYGTDITSVIAGYSKENFQFEDANGSCFEKMPIGDLTLKLIEKAHTAAEPVKENLVESTYTTEGSFDEVVYCKYCGHEMSRIHKTIDVLEKTAVDDQKEKPIIGHTEEKNIAVSPVVDPDVIEDIIDTPEVVPSISSNPSSKHQSVVINPFEKIISEESRNEEPVNNPQIIDLPEETLEMREVEIIALAPEEAESVEVVEAKHIEKTTDNTESIEKINPLKKYIKVIVYTVTTATAGGGLFFVFWFRRRKVKGKIFSRDNLSYRKCLVTLEGSDKLRTYTNKNGEFTFKNLKKDSYILNAYDEENNLLISVELYTEAKDPFSVLENNVFGCTCDRFGKTYVIEVLA